MKEFIKQCLEDLESLTGIRQLYFMQVDPDGKRKIEILIQGILVTCKQFDYISEDKQKNIIREMMVKDQDYDSLNSRVVFKWLNMNKDLYFMDANKSTEMPRVKLSDEENQRIDNLIEQFKNNLIDFRPNFQGIEEDMKKIKQEDEERQSGKRAALKETSNKYLLLHEKKKEAIRKRGIDKLGLHELTSFNIDGEVIVCRNKEEAQEIYLEVYALRH